MRTSEPRERPLDLPAAWERERARAAEGGCLLVLGGVDTGKTTLCGVLARAAFEAGRRTAVVDGDIGQSDIGPPATVGLALVKGDFRHLRELELEALHFVGSCSPERHFLQLAVGLSRMVERARAEDAETVIVDTTGLVSGGKARALKAAKIALLDPDCLIALQRGEELAPLLDPYRFRTRPAVIRLPVSRAAAARSREERAEYRRRRFAEYFAEAELARLSWNEFAFQGSLLGSGRPLAGHLALFASEALETAVIHSEVAEEEALLIVAGPFTSLGLAQVESALGRKVRVAQASAFEDVLVGLLDERGEALAVGSLARIDFKQKKLEVFAPPVEQGRVKVIELGSVRVSPEGEELGSIEPGELG